MFLKDFTRRAVVSSISLATVTALIYFSLNVWFQYIVVAVVATLTGIAIWEYEQFVKTKGGKTLLPALITLGALQVCSFFLAARFFHSWSAPTFVFFIAFLLLIALHFKENNGAIVDLAASAFSLLYIAVPMGILLGILYSQTATQDGRWWIAYLLVVTKITDMGAYVGGCLWGKRKLAPAISPGKTIEGALIGLICAILASIGFYCIGLSSGTLRFHLNFTEALCLGLILGSVGQFGDLAESLLKRDANKKDSNTLPGLGGILDLMDSLLFNSFLVYYYITYYSVDLLRN
ncbi:MAG: CDP-archaeol synthase [Chlamydiia bacterium]|nr:CDP-archaeol synthase [Chlamydiia bacterium]